MTQQWRIIDLINWAEVYFKEKNIENARRETEWFLCEVLNCNRIDLYTQFEKTLSNQELAKFKSFVQRRVKGEPFQQIIEKSTFYGRDFFVSKDVLIPRPETGVIIDILRQKPKVNLALEIGTGSGCIAITMLLENQTEEIIATDISKLALDVAKKNAAQHNVDVNFRKHDILSEKIQSKFDTIISNPPYIALAEFSDLQAEVKNYDPKIALTDMDDGLTFYRKFAELGRTNLNENGFMLFEFAGKNQLADIQNIFTSTGYSMKIHNDLQRDPRIIEVSV